MNRDKILEWTGVITAIIYSLLVALNIGAEFLGFALLLISAILIGLWAYLGKNNSLPHPTLIISLFPDSTILSFVSHRDGIDVLASGGKILP